MTTTSTSAGKMAFLLLAAGASRRMGRIKQLLPLQQQPAILFLIRRILRSGIDEPIVVLGEHRRMIMPVLQGLPLKVAVSRSPDMAGSVQAGLELVEPLASGVMIGLADHPLVLPLTYAILRQRHESHPHHILMPTYGGRGGHPTVFPRDMLAGPVRRLDRIMADARHRVLRLSVDDPGVVWDMDQPQDYQRLLALAAEQGPFAEGRTTSGDDIYA